jgi:hypothetical protein
VRCVCEEPGGHVRLVSTNDVEGAVQDRRETLTAALQVAGIVTAGLLVPCYLIDLAFDTDLLLIMAQAMLAAFACALMVTVWNAQKE